MPLNIELLTQATIMKSYLQLVLCVPRMGNVGKIVYVEYLDCSGLVEEHSCYKSENNDKDFDEESCIIVLSFLRDKHFILKTFLETPVPFNSKLKY